MQGRIIKALAGFYYVEHDGVIYQTRARGNFRKKGQTPYVGDFVEFSAEENSEGYILNGASSNSTNYLDKEFSELLKGCSSEKQRLIYDIAKVIAESDNNDD